MSYVIYDKETTVILFNNRTRKERYASKGAATAALTRMQADADNNDETFDRDAYAIADSLNFSKNIEKMRTVKNLMTGVEFEESVNTPGYCSPACESYYTM